MHLLLLTFELHLHMRASLALCLLSSAQPQHNTWESILISLALVNLCCHVNPYCLVVSWYSRANFTAASTYPVHLSSGASTMKHSSGQINGTPGITIAMLAVSPHMYCASNAFLSTKLPKDSRHVAAGDVDPRLTDYDLLLANLQDLKDGKAIQVFQLQPADRPGNRACALY